MASQLLPLGKPGLLPLSVYLFLDFPCVALFISRRKWRCPSLGRSAVQIHYERGTDMELTVHVWRRADRQVHRQPDLGCDEGGERVRGHVTWV